MPCQKIRFLYEISNLKESKSTNLTSSIPKIVPIESNTSLIQLELL